jgi:hypothetical protein
MGEIEDLAERISLEEAKEIIERLNKGEGLLSLTLKYNIPARVITKLPEILPTLEKKEKMKEEIVFELRKEKLIGTIDHLIEFFSKEARDEENSFDFQRYCFEYLQVCKALKKEAESCREVEKLKFLEKAVEKINDAIKVSNSKITLTSPSSVLVDLESE